MCEELTYVSICPISFECTALKTFNNSVRHSKLNVLYSLLNIHSNSVFVDMRGTVYGTVFRFEFSIIHYSLGISRARVFHRELMMIELIDPALNTNKWHQQLF